MTGKWGPFPLPTLPVPRVVRISRNWCAAESAEDTSRKQDVDARDASAFTRVHSPSKTGVDALSDALCAGMTSRESLRIRITWRCART